MIAIEGNPLTLDEAVAWFQRVAATRDGLKPYHYDAGDLLAEQPYVDAIAQLAVRVFDEGPNVARAAMCSYLRGRPVTAEPLRSAWLRWIAPPAPWLDESGPGGTPLGRDLATAAESCGVARDPATAAGFVARADRDGMWPSWTYAIVHAYPAGRGVAALREGLAHGVVLAPGHADMLAWRYAKDAPHLLAAVATLLADHPVAVREAFLAEARKGLPSDGVAALAVALRT